MEPPHLGGILGLGIGQQQEGMAIVARGGLEGKLHRQLAPRVRKDWPVQPQRAVRQHRQPVPRRRDYRDESGTPAGNEVEIATRIGRHHLVPVRYPHPAEPPAQGGNPPPDPHRPGGRLECRKDPVRIGEHPLGQQGRGGEGCGGGSEKVAAFHGAGPG